MDCVAHWGVEVDNIRKNKDEYTIVLAINSFIQENSTF